MFSCERRSSRAKYTKKHKSHWYMFACTPSSQLSQPTALIQCPYVRGQISVWETVWPEKRFSAPQRVNSHHPPSGFPTLPGLPPLHAKQGILFFSLLSSLDLIVSEKSGDQLASCVCFTLAVSHRESPVYTDWDKSTWENSQGRTCPHFSPSKFHPGSCEIHALSETGGGGGAA